MFIKLYFLAEDFLFVVGDFLLLVRFLLVTISADSFLLFLRFGALVDFFFPELLLLGLLGANDDAKDFFLRLLFGAEEVAVFLRFGAAKVSNLLAIFLRLDVFLVLLPVLGLLGLFPPTFFLEDNFFLEGLFLEEDFFLEEVFFLEEDFFLEEVFFLEEDFFLEEGFFLLEDTAVVFLREDLLLEGTNDDFNVFDRFDRLRLGAAKSLEAIDDFTLRLELPPIIISSPPSSINFFCV